jgi:hypothetical protein
VTTLSSLSALIRAVERARTVSLVAYQLPRGELLDALERAAQRGCRVRVRLEAKPYPDPSDGILRHNRSVVRELRQCGADAGFADVDAGAPLHAKAVEVDRTLYLDDVNFAKNGTLLRVCGRTNIAWNKRAALDSEKRLLERRGNGDRVEVESESIGAGSVIYSALLRLGMTGPHPRLLISREAITQQERKLLGRLENCGVEVRDCSANEKFAVSGARGWIGSANATSSYPNNDVDWSLVTQSRVIVNYLRKSFESRWQRAGPIA